MLAFEFRWRWHCRVWRETHDAMCRWGYRREDTRVWNFWDEDVPFPVEINGPKNAALAMARESERKALVVVSDFAEGGTYRIKPDVVRMFLEGDWKAFDFESGKELPVEGGAALVSMPKHDFRIVEFR